MNNRKIFVASCLALVATSMAFSIRADIIPALKADFGFTDTEMGQVAGPGLWGFAITIVLGGLLVDALGMKRILALACFGHIAGVLLTVTATGFRSLYIATLVIGLSNGLVEAVVNPLTATLYPHAKARHLNILHAWWPGGLIVGGLGAYGLTKFMGLDLSHVPAGLLSLGWKLKMGLILIPAVVYGALALGQEFPQTERAATGVSTRDMLLECLRPMFIVFVVLMMLTSAAELGPDQWVGNLLQHLVGIQGILLLVYTAGIMFVFRQFLSGYFISRLTTVGVLCFASALTCIGLYGLSIATTPATVFYAATVFGIGKSFFWPNMIGTVAEKFPRGGALSLGIMGGAGMFAVGWLMAPIMGRIQDYYAVSELPENVRQLVVSGNGIDERKVMAVTDPSTLGIIDVAKQVSAAMTYRWISVVPALLFFVFLFLYFHFRRQSGNRRVRAVQDQLTKIPGVPGVPG